MRAENKRKTDSSRLRRQEAPEPRMGLFHDSGDFLVAKSRFRF